jgi:hypothetical protein
MSLSELLRDFNAAVLWAEGTASVWYVFGVVPLQRRLARIPTTVPGAGARSQP